MSRPVVEQLVRCRSQQVTIEFEDGEVIDAVLLDVDPTEHEDITFDVIRAQHTTRGTRYDTKNVYVAPISSVKGVTLIASAPQ